MSKESESKIKETKGNPPRVSPALNKPPLETTKVYVVLATQRYEPGQYIVAVYSDKQNAKDLISSMPDAEHWYYWYEEFPLNKLRWEIK